MSVGTGTLAAIFGCAGPVLTDAERAFFRAADPFGFILFARNVESPVQLRHLTADLRDAVGRDAVITVDQEGGRVQRLTPPHWRGWLPPLDMVARAANPVRAMELRARIIAHELRGVGIDSNCAPCADLAGELTHPFLKNRCYGTDPEQVSAIARAVADGHLAGGVLPIAKHMPGHGRATLDTHHELPRVDESLDTLTATDFAPFHDLRDLPMAMTAHIVFTALDPDHPATQSAAVVSHVRQGIGFDGLLLTDDLNMQALSGTLGERTARSIAAGCDIALHCKGDLAEMEAVAANAGAQTPQAKRRAQAALAQRHPPEPVDIEALEAELRQIMREDGPYV